MIRRFLFALTLALAGSFALPSTAAEPKKVIVVGTTAGFRHSSIPYAVATIKMLGEKSGAYTVVDTCDQPDIAVPKKPNKPNLKADANENDKKNYEKALKKYEEDIAKWTPEMEADMKAKQEQLSAGIAKELEKISPANLKAKGIDLVVFANTTGMLPFDRDGFIKWIEEGHAFVGTHSASDTLHDHEGKDNHLKYAGYVEMLQGEFQTHRSQVAADLVAGDTKHPANAGIGESWNIAQEEMYLIKSQDRSKVHSIWFLRHDPNFKDQKGFFPVSWCRMAGKGRVFYTSLGHREDLWTTDPELKGRVNSVETAKQYQAHLLAGIKWALGLVQGSAEPNPSVE